VQFRRKQAYSTVPVVVCSISGPQLQLRIEVHVVEDECLAASPNEIIRLRNEKRDKTEVKATVRVTLLDVIRRKSGFSIITGLNRVGSEILNCLYLVLSLKLRTISNF
jgi:hypothetical protein